MTDLYPKTSAALRDLGIDPNKVPVVEDAITARGVLIWNGELSHDEMVTERMAWPDESFADVAHELIATFEVERDLLARIGFRP